MAAGRNSNSSSSSRPTASERAAAKRRQVRKGTRSCWECRRRKVRCIFDETAPSDTCRTCWQKGTPCVSQEFPEGHVPQTKTPVGSVGDRLGRMERLVERLYQRTDNDKSPAPNGARQDVDEGLLPDVEDVSAGSSIHDVDDGGGIEVDHHDPGCSSPRELEHSGEQPTSRIENPTTTERTTDNRHQSRLELNFGISVNAGSHISNSHLPVVSGESVTARPHFSTNAHLSVLSRELTDALPSAEDCEVIHRLYSDADLVFQLMLNPHGVLETLQPEPMENFVAGLYEPMHPVLLAKKMLTLATMLQRIPSTYAQESSASTSPRRIMERLAEAAISVVCENNRLMGSIDVLQCIILQTVYLANGGNLRLSVLACRRAISVAQLMGIHRPHDPSTIETVDPSSSIDTGFVWFRIVYLERFVCLLLGLPDSTRDHHSAMAFDGTMPPPLDDHPVGRLEQVHCAVALRIIQRNQQDSFASMVEVTRALDLEMQAAAAAMPPRWWTIPRYNGRGDKPLGAVTESLRLCSQLFHYFLLIELHLPFMLRHSRDGAASSSRMACIDASREVLARFVAIRSAKGVCSIPDAADFFALIAAMTLLLSHIDARRRDRGNDILAHQRHTDRDKVEETLELMRDGSSMSMDVFSVKSADVLWRLLEIEARAAKGSTFTASLTPSTVSTPCTTNDGPNQQSQNAMQLKIPYYGTVTISPDALPSREPFKPVARGHEWNTQTQQNTGTTLVDSNITVALDQGVETAMNEGSGSNNLLLDVMNASAWIAEDANAQPLGPGFSARVDDWAFQGVDAAFFDSMIRGVEGPDS